MVTMLTMLSEEELEELEEETIARAAKRDKKVDLPRMRVDGTSVRLLWSIIQEKAERIDKANKLERIDKGR